MKLPGLKISIRELFNLEKDPTITVSSTPFGADLEKEGKQLIIKRAVPWKGVKGIDNVKKINRRVGETIEKLARVSSMLSGPIARGTVVVNYKGKVTMMPKKAFLMAKLAGKPIEMISERKALTAFRTDINTYERNVIRFLEKTGEREAVEMAYRIGALE